MHTMRRAGWMVLITLTLVAWGVWTAVLQQFPDEVLKVSFLDVGQGDAVFIQSPAGNQMLIDGGADRTVLRRLADEMPWYDRTIDVILATHPDTDHVGGLFDVLGRYKVTYIFRPGIQHDAPAAQSLLLQIAKEKKGGAQEVLARRGQVIDLGGGVYIEILFPDRNVSEIETNTGSIVLRVVYEDTAFMLTGDSPQSIEEYLVGIDSTHLESTVLKAGHHGSRTSSSVAFVGYVSPQYGVFSRGCDNSYGHPHREVVDLLDRFEIRVVDTCEEGTITFISDGKVVSKR